MGFSEAVALFATMALLSAAPGPVDWVLVSCALRHGWRTAALMVVGIVLADFVFILLAVAGWGLVATTMQPLFFLLRGAAALVLFWFAWGLLNPPSGQLPPTSSTTAQYASGFSSGFLLTFSDPKAILFYLGLLPAFVDLEQPDGRAILIVLLCAALAIGLVKAIYISLAQRVGGLLAGRPASLWLNRLAGLCLVAIGGYLLVSLGWEWLR